MSVACALQVTAGVTVRSGKTAPALASFCSWGVSDPLKVPKTVDAMRKRGIDEAQIEQIVWRNPIAFFGQSGRLDLGDDGAPLGVDQRELFEGNSVLRGQTPIVER